MNQSLKIYFTSDVHGYFFPTDFRSAQESDIGLLKCENQFRRDKNTLIIDGGDALQGSPLASYCHDILGDAAQMSQLMNQIGYNFVTLGNHDFNYGIDYQRQYLSHLNAQISCVNLREESGKQPYPECVIQMPNGLKVGVVGMVTDYVPVWEKAENLSGFEITDALEEAREAIMRLKGQVDVTIGIYHGGLERDPNSGKVYSTTRENRAYEIAEALDFDLLLTGHQHMHLEGRDIQGTFVVQPDCFAREFVEIHFTKTPEGKHFTSQHHSASGTADREKQQRFSHLSNDVEHWLDEKVGTLPSELAVLSPLEMALHGSALADFYNKLQLEFTGAEISATSLANEVKGIPEEVHRRDLLIAYPYSNTFVKLEVTGEVLRQALERSAAYFDLDAEGEPVISERFLKPKVEHYNYDYYAGLEYQFDLTRPVGDRVVRMERAGEPIRPEEHLTMCLNSYRASGTGGYDFYRDCPVLQEYSEEMIDLLFGYFNKNEKHS